MRPSPCSISVTIDAVVHASETLSTFDTMGEDDHGLARTVLVLLSEMASRWPPEYFMDDEIDMIGETAELATRMMINSATNGEYEL